MKKVIVVTARKESSRLPGKNKRRLGMTPLVFWTLKEAQWTEGIDQVRLITDDDDLIGLVTHEMNDLFLDGGLVSIDIMREPNELGVNEKHIEAILWGIDDLSMRDDVILLQNSPFRTHADIERFLEVYTQKFPLVSVTPKWDICGAIYICTKELLVKFRSFHTPYTKYIPLPFPNCLDIDTERDWALAERVLKQRRKEYF